MSRIGRLPIDIPAGVTVSVNGREVNVKGPKGELALTVAQPLEVSVEENQVLVTRPDDERESRSLHGLTRTLINNNIIGVTQGYSKGLEVVGTGYRVAQKGSSIEFALGFSHPVLIDPPAGITLTVEGNNKVTVSGIDKQAVGEAAANIRKIRKPEPYKGKVCGTRARSCAARPERVVSDHGCQDKVCRSCSSSRAPSQEGRRHRAAPPPRRDAFGAPRVRPGRGRQQGPHVASASTLETDLRGFDGDKTAKARKVGELVAERAKAVGVSDVVFDRGGNRYAGRVAAIADGAREGGLNL